MSRIKDKFNRHRLAPEDGYLSYWDIRLTKLDVDSVKNDWLTDNVIAFWEEYLEREELTHYPQARIVLLRPSMAYMLMITPDPLTIKSALPKFDGITHIFLPINDNPDAMRPEGGAHWSLLLVSIIDGVSFHYDSMFPHNSGEARKTSRKLEVLLNKHLRFVDMNDAPQQANGSDCGVFVCLNMRHLLLERLLKVDANNKITMTMRADDVNSVQGRKEIYKLIEDLRKEGERRRSRSKSPSGGLDSDSKSPPRIGPPEENEGNKSQQ